MDMQTRAAGMSHTPTCAGVPYVFGDAGSNSCPVLSTRIVNEAPCQIAATAVRQVYGSFAADPMFPKGCHSYNGYVYYNLHPVGAGELSSKLLCASCPSCGNAPIGAPLWPSHSHARLRWRVPFRSAVRP